MLGRRRLRRGRSDRDPLHDVPRDLPPSPVVDSRGPCVGVPGEVLHVLQRHVLNNLLLFSKPFRFKSANKFRRVLAMATRVLSSSYTSAMKASTIVHLC
jgi:hypothetical protein